MQIWRSAGWPCQDGIEIDLLAARLVSLHDADQGRATLRLTEAGIQALAQARQSGQRALSPHDRLAQKLAEALMAGGRIVWRELALRARIGGEGGAGAPPQPEPVSLWDEAANEAGAEAEAPGRPQASPWRVARPDIFSVRNTTVEAYLHPVVHEVKFSRADLLSDLRHAAKRQAYQWLCCECHYVFPAAVAEPDEIPEAFGVSVLHGDIEGGRFELLRPARHRPCTLPFSVWLALAKAAPVQAQAESAQAGLGDEQRALP